jgi:hypothetical protein
MHDSTERCIIPSMRAGNRLSRLEDVAPRLLYFYGALAVLLLTVWLTLDARPPWYYPMRAFQLGWVPVAWHRPLIGHWTLAFERSEFRPCTGFSAGIADSSEWYAQTDRISKQLVAAVWADAGRRKDTTVFVSWAADVSPRGSYGHMGRYTRAAAVTYLMGVRIARSDDCEVARTHPELFLEH